MYRWFDSGQDDGLIERELDVVHYAQTPPPPPPPPQEPIEEDERGYCLLHVAVWQHLLNDYALRVRVRVAPCLARRSTRRCGRLRSLQRAVKGKKDQNYVYIRHLKGKA